MIYYRIALQKQRSTQWAWRSLPLHSVAAVFQLCRRYSAYPAERLRVFVASEASYMDLLLARENLGLPSNSQTIDQFVANRQWLTIEDVRRFEEELGWHNAGEMSPSLAAPEQGADDPNSEHLQLLETAEQEQEAGAYDEPYIFELPKFAPHTLALIKLMARVRSGELVP